MSILLVSAVACFLSVFALAALGVILVVRSERRREAWAATRAPERTDHSTADVSLYLRFEGQGARAMDALLAEHGPYGIVPHDALAPVAEALLGALDDATHGALVVAGFKVAPVRTREQGGLLVCLRARTRVPLTVPDRPTHRRELAALLRALAACSAEEVVSADFVRASVTSDPAAPALEVLLGPHPAPPAT